MQSTPDAAFRSACWDTREVAGALRYLGPRQADFMVYLAGLLNRYHRSNKPAAYYDLLCGEWVMHFSHVVYAAYLDVTRGGAVASQQSPLFGFSDFYDYQWTVVGKPAFSAQLRQQVAGLLDGADRANRGFARRSVTFGGPQSGLRQRVKSGARRLRASALSNANAPFLFCHPYVKCSRLEWAATLVKWRRWARHDDLDYPIEAAAAVDAEWRRRASAEISVSGYPDLVCALVPLYIPALYLEAFSAYRQQALGLRLPRPQAVYTATSLHGHSLFKVLAADWREEGTRIINHQHGGGYGIDRMHASEEYETRVADRFCTMGWQGDSPKQVPLATPLSASQFRCAKSNRRILLTCIHYPKQVYRIHFQPMPGTIETMIADTAAFVRGSSDWPDLVVRSFPNDYDSGMVDILREANPAIHLDDMQVPGLQSYTRSALVVHSYLGTSWLETLALNIPTVCFYDPMTYAFRDAAKPFIDRFEAAGVLHRNGASAAKFVAGVMNDPQAWWQTPELQRLREEFVANYANFSPDWSSRWEAELKPWIH
jgi:putative transferase (TIGR04331 family)